jgi:GMC oxidoreductase
VNSPQLLMLSGVGPADELRRHNIKLVHHSPGVGSNLQDHLHADVTYRCTKPVSINRNQVITYHKHYAVREKNVTENNLISLSVLGPLNVSVPTSPCSKRRAEIVLLDISKRRSVIHTCNWLSMVTNATICYTSYVNVTFNLAVSQTIA